MYDLIIIGADSAGLTAGIYAGRKKMNTLIVTKKIGGQSVLTDSIENFPGFDSISGADLINKIKTQVNKYNVPIKEGVEVEGIDVLNPNGSDKIFKIKIKDGDEIETKTIIIATGKNRKMLNVPGEKEFENKGVSSCTICDAPLFSGKEVVVIGGGNSALESATDLTQYATKITILTRGDKFRGDELTIEKLKKTGKVEFIFNAQVKEIKGTNFVEKIIYEDSVSRETREVNAGGVFVNIGWIPATGFLNGLVELNGYGETVVDPKTFETSINGIYAAGDVTDTIYKQNVIAAAQGATATLSAYNYLTKA